MNIERLRAKVKAINRGNQMQMDLFNLLSPFFTPLVGCKILKADGSLLAKLQKTMPAVPSSAWKHGSNYSLAWGIRVCEEVEGEDRSQYAETMCYVGNLKGDVLESMYKPFTLRTDYTVDEVMKNRKTYADAQKIADAAKSALHPFGEYE